jgi:hypothetical protein
LTVAFSWASGNTNALGAQISTAHLEGPRHQRPAKHSISRIELKLKAQFAPNLWYVRISEPPPRELLVPMAFAVHDATVPADADGVRLVGEEASEDACEVSAVSTTVITLCWVQDFNSGAEADMIGRLCDTRSLNETCVSASSYLLQRVTS